MTKPPGSEQAGGEKEGLARRNLFRGVAGLGTAAALPIAAQPASAPPPGTLAAWRAGNRTTPAQPGPFRFFNAAEARFIEAAVDRLIPADDEWPGALWAGVPAYIDGQLAGAYGHGARFYAAGPWAAGTPSQGYQYPLNPSQLYRASLTALLEEAGRRQFDFAAASEANRDAFLHEMEAGRLTLAGLPSSVFFETLLSNTIEGWFADPAYGGNRDMVAWRMVGFPGAHAAFLPLYTHHGMRLDREPYGMREVAAREGHRHG
jgi:gluconate 2-dehydrogenase gamma chain